MKKILVVVAGLMLAAACAAPPTNQSAPTVTSTPSTLAPTMTEADAIAKEKAIWDTIKIKDYDAFGNMLAEDQVEVTSEGVHDKASSIAGVKEFEPTEVIFSDWKYLSIDKDAYAVTYTVNMKGKFRGKEFAEAGRASSAWVNRGGKWLAIYHQECAVKPPPPPAKETAAKTNANKNANTAATASASPAATPAPATGPDASANEKLVWDFFKSKNFDAFAAVLAPDFLEVEADKVYNKAESVKTLSEFLDASKSVLSDWQVVKFDDDVSLVTYVAKFPGGPANGERHSTIWANRDGKWLAVLHHGSTPVEKVAAMAAASPSPAAKAAASPAAKTSPAAKATPR